MIINKYIGSIASYKQFADAIANKDININGDKIIVQKGRLAERVISRQLSHEKISLGDMIKHIVGTIFSKEYRQAKEIVAYYLPRFKHGFESKTDPYFIIYKKTLEDRLSEHQKTLNKQFQPSVAQKYFKEDKEKIKQEIKEFLKEIPVDTANLIVQDFKSQLFKSKNDQAVKVKEKKEKEIKEKNEEVVKEKAEKNVQYYMALNSLKNDEDKDYVTVDNQGNFNEENVEQKQEEKKVEQKVGQPEEKKVESKPEGTKIEQKDEQKSEENGFIAFVKDLFQPKKPKEAEQKVEDLDAKKLEVEDLNANKSKVDELNAKKSQFEDLEKKYEDAVKRLEDHKKEKTDPNNLNDILKGEIAELEADVFGLQAVIAKQELIGLQNDNDQGVKDMCESIIVATQLKLDELIKKLNAKKSIV